jgi:3-oxoadipate enol-lactonase
MKQHPNLYFELSGPENAPLVVFSHALGSSLRVWDRQSAALSSRYRVLRYDIRGHGRSAMSSEPITLADLGNDVLRLMDGFSVQSAHFCGLSLGGMIGQWLALHAADRLWSLTLADTAPQMGTAETWDARMNEIRQGGMNAVASATMQRWFTPQFRQEHPETVSETESIFCSTPVAGYLLCAQVVRGGVLPKEKLAKFGAVNVPALVMTGTQDSAATPAEAQQLASFFPNARYKELPAAHLSAVEAAEAFTAALNDFLSSVSD